MNKMSGSEWERRLEFIRNLGAGTMQYLRAGKDKTALEEALMTLLGFVRDEIQRHAFSSESTPSLPNPKSSKPKG